MNVIKNYKLLSYSVLVAVVVFSFIFTNFLLNQIINDKIPSYSVVYIIIVIVLNFGMFFIVFRLIQILAEKETIITELTNHINSLNKEQQISEVVEDSKTVNYDQLIEQIMPQSPQTLGLNQFSEKLLANIAQVTEISQGILYFKNKESGEFHFVAKYAFYSNQDPKSFYEGETLPGQVAKDKKILNISQIPDSYFLVKSGLGQGKATNLLIVPIVEKDVAVAIIELASFKPFDQEHEKLFEKLAQVLGKIVLKIK